MQRHDTESAWVQPLSPIFAVIGAVCAGLGVGGGAFAAHALKASLSPEMLQVFETGVRYQMYHALALVILGSVRPPERSGRWFQRAGWLFVAGILVFSGSLYALSLTEVRLLGALTPIGGLAFLLGWGCAAWGAWQWRSPSTE